MRDIRKVASRCSVVALVVCLLVAPSRSGTRVDMAIPQNASKDPVPAEWHYDVVARVRLLFFWTGWKDVGEARIRRSESDSARHLELLIGTDPERAPLQINRWGYIVETVCGPSTQIVGVMTASEEETIEQATAQVRESSSAKHIFKAIRGSLTKEEALTEIFQLALIDDLTYRDVDALLLRLPPPGNPRRVPLPSGAHRGFLTAVSTLLQQTQAEYRRTRNLTPQPPQPFLFGGTAYDLALRSAKLDSNPTLGGQESSPVIKTEFQIRNHVTGKVTRFTITGVVNASMSGAPLRVTYQPRWWLQIELRLRNPAPIHAAETAG